MIQPTKHLDDRALALASLDEADPELVAARAHAATCEACAQALVQSTRLLTMIDETSEPPPDPNVLRQISAKMLHELSFDEQRRDQALTARFSLSRLKALYLSAAVIVQLALVLHAIVMLALGHGLAWLGVAFAIGAVPVRVLSYFVISTPRTSKWMPGLLAAALGGASVVVVTAGSHVALAESLVGVTSAFYYVVEYSRFRRRPSAQLAVGTTLPHFELEDDRGLSFGIERYLGAPMVLVFFRGNWCPLCTAQIQEIAAQYRWLQELGVKVALISPQPHHNARVLSQRFNVPLDFLVDPGARVARSLGIVHDGGVPVGLALLGYEADTVFPTVVVVDRDGKILFSDQTDNYRLRPEPATFMSVLAVARS